MDGIIKLLNDDRPSQFSMRLPSFDADKVHGVSGLTFMRRQSKTGNDNAHYQWQHVPVKGNAKKTEYDIQSRPLSDKGKWTVQTCRLDGEDENGAAKKRKNAKEKKSDETKKKQKREVSK